MERPVSSAFYKETGLIIGVYNAYPPDESQKCTSWYYGMGGIYANERAFNILNYGDTYYNNSQFPYMDPELACAASSQAMAGSGTESDPYQVENLCHLRDMENIARVALHPDQRYRRNDDDAWLEKRFCTDQGFFWHL